MAKDRYGEEIDTDEKEDKQIWTYKISAPIENAKPITMILRCGICRKPLFRPANGWCQNCHTWTTAVNPARVDSLGHPVNADGFCYMCQDYKLSRMDVYSGEWVDSGIVGKRLTKEDVKHLAKDMQAKMSGPGWPEKRMPLRRDCIPRSWRRYSLKVVGQTELGHDIVIPETHAPVDTPPAGDGLPAGDVPF